MRVRTTGIGSMPHSLDKLPDLIQMINKLDIPFWPQLSSLKEDMLLQVAKSIPALKIIEDKDIRCEYKEEELYKFYEKFEERDIEYFKISSATGFWHFLNNIERTKAAKGQIVGPITFTSTMKGANGKYIYHNDLLCDVVVKAIGLEACWQVKKIKEYVDEFIIFLDEPCLSSFGSAFFTLDRDKIKSMLSEVINLIKEYDNKVAVGIHCCGNTDWSLLLDLPNLDILSFDAYNFMDNLLLYSDNLKRFLTAGKILALGSIPNSFPLPDDKDIQAKLKRDILEIKKISGIGELDIILTPTCGLGGLEEKQADKILDLLHKFGQYASGL